MATIRLDVQMRSSWLNRLPFIIDELSTLPEAVINRPCFERIFGLKRRRAIELMHELGSFRSGRGYLLDRMGLLRALEALESKPQYRWACQTQQEGIRESLQDYDQTHSTLPEGVRLEQNRLTVTFRNLDELVERLSTLVHSLTECVVPGPPHLKINKFLKNNDG